jgi:hypothetical protein
MIKIGKTSLEPFHFSILLLIILTFLQTSRLPAIVTVLRANSIWIVPFVFYFFLLIFSLAYSKYSGGQQTVFRQFTGILLAVSVASRIAYLPNAGPSLYIGGVASFFSYYFALFISAQYIDVSLVGEFRDFALSGDFNALTYELFRPAFNAFQDLDSTFHASLRNNISCSLLLSYLFVQIGARSFTERRRKSWFNLFVSIFLLFSILIIQSRSVIASLILSLVVVSVMEIRKIKAKQFFVGMMGLVALLLVAVVWSDLPIMTGLYERLVLDTQSYQVRLRDYQYGIRHIDQNILFGIGYFEVAPGGYRRPHNLFLGAWTQAGLFAFLASILFVFGFSYIWVKSVAKCLQDGRYWRLPHTSSWVMALPTMAMFRLWSSGDGGNLNFPAWLSLGVFLGLVMANRRQQVARAIPARKDSSAPRPDGGRVNQM